MDIFNFKILKWIVFYVLGYGECGVEVNFTIIYFCCVTMIVKNERGKNATCIVYCSGKKSGLKNLLLCEHGRVCFLC